MHYTGVGSRKTPPDVLELIVRIAMKAAQEGYVLRSGGADGADKAFERGCDLARGSKEIYYANQATAEAMTIAAKFHPAWNACTEYARKLHGRNAFQVLGITLNKPSERFICWTPDGCVTHAQRTRATGGTGTAISIAHFYGINICNLALPTHRAIMEEWVK